MEIVFLNTLNGQLREPISDFIARHSDTTDVFCLQEAFHAGPNMHSICRRLLSDFECIEAEKSLDNEDCFGQATFIRRKVKLLRTGTVFAQDSDIGLGIVTQIEVNRQAIAICNFHGVSKPGSKKDTEARIRQSQCIIKAMQQYEHRRIIGGDFNLDLDTQSVRLFTEAGYDNLITKYSIKTTRNNIAWDMYPQTPQMYADYVFTDPGLDVKQFIVPDTVISDHQPMILRINV